ncbi:MAG TPA: ATP-binding cassette domain-containing protein, partial [Telluria sp.]
MGKPAAPAPVSAPILAVEGIHKQFPGVKALSGAGLNLYPGEVHTLMGQNGAGKSTLIKVLTGVYTPDSGSIVFDGAAIAPRGVQEAQAIGISTVYQEVNLCPNLSVAENLFIGDYPRRFGMVDWRTMRAGASALLAQLQVEIDVAAPLNRYPLAIQQMVAIARALRISARVLILDEPTSSLDEAEVQLLFGVLRRLRAQGMAILFVTHFIEQTYAISDRITVMRNGEREGEYLCSDLSRIELVNKMVGAARQQEAQAPVVPSGSESSAPVLLRARGLAKKGALAPLDLAIHEGEMLGLCGLLGSGRTETARLL